MSTKMRTDPEQAVIRVTGFAKRYKQHVAVQGVNLTVHRGELYGLIGPDGAGKTTLLKAIAGVLAHDSGTVEVLGTVIDSEHAAEQIKAQLGFMPQGLGLNLYPELSVEENIDFFAQLRLLGNPELTIRKNRLLNMTRLEPFRSRAMKHLSGGMKQKLGLICALIHQPELLILDEPTTGVDPVSRRDFWAILAELVHEGKMTAILSTAYMDEASRFDRLSLMFQGRTLASGEPDAIIELAPGSKAVAQATPQLAAVDRLKKAGLQVATVGPWLHIFGAGVDAHTLRRLVTQALYGLHITALELHEPDLEDVFINLVRCDEGEPTQEPVGSAGIQSPAAEGPAIAAERLVRDFGAFRAVDGVSFTVLPGEIFGLLGANGAGKTTVIKMLNGILKPSDGEGRVAGAEIRRGGGAIKERIGYMSQAFSLYLDLTVVENIQLFAGIYGLNRVETHRRLEWIMSMAGLVGYEAELTGRLPMGVRQRLALGCALVHRPRVLFLDEPTSGVDPVGRRRFWSILVRLAREEAVAILVTTHYMSEAEHCDRLALMYAGRIISTGSPHDMKEALQREAGQLLEVSTSAPQDALRRLIGLGFAGATLHGREIHVLSKRAKEDQKRIRAALEEAAIQLTAIVPRALTLEDVFVYRVMAMEGAQRDEVLP
jgi:ABC-2 type transport system ATP-binding protein